VAETVRTIVVRRDVLADVNADAAAERVRMAKRGTLVVHLVSSPGSGKTTLLEATARRFAGRRRIAVLVGDIETDRDARRLGPLAPTVQLTTGGACHLEFPLVRRGIDALGDGPLEYLFIENVGNLVCPASHDLGEHLRVVLISVTEGDDKPGKYPKMFRTSRLMLVSKCDLLPHVPFSMDRVAEDARRIQPDLDLIAVAALDGTGMESWCDYLERERDRLVGD